MSILVAVAAAAGCAIGNGISTVFQKSGADEEANVRSFDLTLLLRLLKNLPYTIGISLELISWALSLVALRVLPLFLVQSVMAASIIITAIGERLKTGVALRRRVYGAISVVLVGLVCVGSSAEPGAASIGNATVHVWIEVAPLGLFLLGGMFIYIRHRVSATVLALLSGASFGGTSIGGRIILYPHHFWQLAENPLAWAIIIYGILGQYLFTVALQRASGTKTNALMIAAETLVPSLVGIAYFSDRIRPDFVPLVALGSVIVVIGCIAIAAIDSEVPLNVAIT